MSEKRKDLKDERLKFTHLTHYYSDFTFKFLKHNIKDLNTKMSILDAGCGHCRHLNLFYNLGFQDLTGIDIIKRKEINKYKYIKADIQEDLQQVLSQQYDIVLCNFVLMFIQPENQIKTIKNLIEATKKYLLIETRKIGGQYSYECDIEAIKQYIELEKSCSIIYFNKNKERIIAKIWEAQGMQNK